MAFKKGYLEKHEWQDLNKVYREVIDRHSSGTSSPWGDHYLLVQKLKDFGITDVDVKGSGVRVENFVQDLLIYNEIPDLF